ncbi:uncharacterized protein PFLUO_LOCUS4012 [Penicillium psychrofluorescens]|uniref:uncharacterized protein n=1 Tax=Penicillium psychrofluorescens TaxID=3158075 RepID=UPI003CCCF674
MAHSGSNTPGTTPHAVIPIDIDTDSDYDFDPDDGGMQLDPPEPAFAVPRLGSLRGLHAGMTNDVSPLYLQYHSHKTEYSIPDLDSPRSDQSARMSHTATLKQDASAHNRIREEKNAALAVLTNWELLMTYALANNESVPMTRRRFTAKLIAPGNPQKQEELVAERWVVNSENGPVLVPGRRRIVVDNDDSGWKGPRKPRTASSGTASPSRSGSRSGSRSVSAGHSPAHRGNKSRGRKSEGSLFGS